MIKKITVVSLIALAFVAGYMLPKPDGKCKAETNSLVKGQAYKAGDYTIFWRSYRGRGGKIFQKIDIQGKYNLIGATYKKGATIEEKK